MKNITVLTPSYNRKTQLERLYISLCQQTDKDFTWMIIDDGSTDDSKDAVNDWILRKEIDINYVYKTNGGKHTALNLGISLINSVLTFIVDSDDYLISEAIQTVKNDYSKCDDKIGGLSYLKRSEKGYNLTNKTIPQNGMIESFCECRYGRSIKGDMAEVWVTKYLKKYPFAEFENEKFLSEDTVWVQISGQHKLKYFNKPIYIADYLEGGLTKSRRTLNKESPLGCMYRGEIHLEAGLPFKYRVRAMLYFTVYGHFAGYRCFDLFNRSKHKVLFVFCLPISIILYLKWK